MNDCFHDDIDFDDEPDYMGCHGMCMKWFGTCQDCGQRVYELWEPKGIRD